MTRRCELTGKLPLSGQLRSHAENKTKRKFRPNLVNVTLMSEALQKSVKLRVSASALKTVEHRGGLDAFLKKARNEELSEQCLKRRIPDKATLSEELRAWEQRRNAERGTIKWMFTVDKAREKMARCYPSIPL